MSILANIYLAGAIGCLTLGLTLLLDRVRPLPVLDDVQPTEVPQPRAEYGVDKQWGDDLHEMAAEIKVAKTLHLKCVMPSTRHGADAHLDEARELVRGGVR
jgi:hypothetical protein